MSRARPTLARGPLGALRAVLRAVWPRPEEGPDRQWFERWDSRSRDPWGIETSPYEHDRHRRTLDLLEGRRFSRALEVGCSSGVFTEALAPLCAELLAVDTSAVAVDRARARLGPAPGVTIEQRSLPDELPPGPFDLIVCADVLYYWSSDLLLEAQRAFERELAPGGVLLACHYRPKVRIQPLTGDEVHDLLIRCTTLEHVRSDAWSKHRLDRFDKL